jgi:hypothetical protein
LRTAPNILGLRPLVYSSYEYIHAHLANEYNLETKLLVFGWVFIGGMIMKTRLILLSIISLVFFQSCSADTPAPKKITAMDVYLAFKSAGLEAVNPHALVKEDYGMAPYVCTGGYFALPSLCPDCGGRIFECNNSQDINSLATYYDGLGKIDPSFFSWVFIKGNILVQINGSLPEESAMRYKQAIPGPGTAVGNQPISSIIAPVGQLASPTTNAVGAPSPLELVETGYTIDPSSYGGPYIHYGYILKNPNTNTGAIRVPIRITARDANDAVIGTQTDYIDMVMPGETSAWGWQLSSNGKQPAKVDFEVIDPGNNWRDASLMSPVGFKPFQVIGLQANSSLPNFKITGEISNPNNTPFAMVGIAVIIRDSNRKLLTVFTSFVQSLSANGRAPFEVMTLGDVPANVAFEAYARIVQMTTT